MKLLSIVSGVTRGGATVSFLNLILGLRKRGVDVYVITPKEGYLTDELKKSGIEYSIVSYGFSVWPTFHGWYRFPHYIIDFIREQVREQKAVNKIECIAKIIKPDIIHTNVSVINIGYRVSKRMHIPHVWHIREYGDRDFNLHVFPSRRSFIKRLDKSWAIAITEDLKVYNCSKSKCSVIYNGIMDSVRLSNCKKENVFLYAGRITKNKGCEDLIRAFVLFTKNNTEFTLNLLGSVDSYYKVYLESILSGSAAEGRVRFLGTVLEQDLYERMQRAWAIVVPSFYEGFGRIAAEAMFNNCLVIGRDTAGTKEQFDNGLKETGFEIGFRFETSEDLARVLNTVAKMSLQEIKKYTRRAGMIVEKYYTIENNVNKTIDFFYEILSNK